MDNNLMYTIVALINALAFMAAMTNLLLYPLSYVNKFLIYLYIAFCQLSFGHFLGQNITFFTIGGALLIIAASSKHFISNIIFALLGYLMAIFLNYALTAPLNLLGITVTTIYSNNYYLIIFVIIYSILTYFSTHILGKYFKNKFIKNTPIFSPQIQLLFIIEVVLCTIIFILNIIQAENEGYSPNIIYFNTILFGIFFIITLIIFFFCLRIMQKNHALLSIQQEKQSQEEYMRKLEDLYQDMRIFKHDYMNILSTMQYYINENDTENLKEFFAAKILPGSEKLAGKNAIIGKLSLIKLLELKGILYAKLVSAMNQDLDVTVEIQKEINCISMDMLDLSTVVGAFMDNAIEAAKETEDKRIVILIIYNPESTIIIISNSTPAMNIQLDAIYEKEVSYKSGHSGLGLYSANKIISKYSNIIHSTNYDNCIFTQTLEICQTS